MGRLDGKVAIITGGARGMGASHVRRFINEGAKVILTDILFEEGQALANELGENAKFMKHDVTSAADWDQVVAEAEAKFGPVDILVNNAGIAPNNPIEETTEEEYQKVIDVNQVSVFLGMKAVYSSMRQTKNGSIVNISSLSGLIAGRNQISYVASKFAVRGMTKAAALEFGEYGIRVNSIHPGIIETPMTMNDETKAMLAEISKTIPLGRTSKPEEVTNLVIYLASEESSYSTGSEFVIDGGLFAQ
ncbi:SDR family NAD(P)-dependent oxidoreductase [Virgibacillus oceani]|uniref:3-alpha-(Or 20-beta)-hydroxysteroid dehydrogenase n=1 Tax=Virgibacillus oceani TaxID=1479511 RepID=A0A917HGV1_9BACI|nr:glucose 1-dehydrogenase [Virgibacillus oceani]GGG78783.1 3-alpha-(or 20-beta)-hydroxysteroid dehydrogenase [Virgibacillus oceani]